MSWQPGPPPTMRVREAMLAAGGRMSLPALMRHFGREMQLMSVRNTLVSMKSRGEAYRDNDTGQWVLVDEQELSE